MTNENYVRFGIDFEATPERTGKALARFVSTYPAAEDMIQRCLLAQVPYEISARKPDFEEVARYVQKMLVTKLAQEQREIVIAYVREVRKRNS